MDYLTSLASPGRTDVPLSLRLIGPSYESFMHLIRPGDDFFVTGTNLKGLVMKKRHTARWQIDMLGTPKGWDRYCNYTAVTSTRPVTGTVYSVDESHHNKQVSNQCVYHISMNHRRTWSATPSGVLISQVYLSPLAASVLMYSATVPHKYLVHSAPYSVPPIDIPA